MADDPKGTRRSPALGVPRLITERGPHERDRLVPKHPTPESWDRDETPPNIADPETYRAVRDLKEQTAAQDVQIAVLVNEVSGVKARVGEVGAKVDKINDSVVRIATIVEEDRNQITVTQTKMIATQTASATTKETLADRVLTIEGEARRFKHAAWGQIIGGVFSGGVLVALIALISERC